MPPMSSKLFPAPSHNHDPCLAQALDKAQVAFAAKQLRLTDLRRQVLLEIAGSHTAIGAYELLDRLARKGTRLAPISIYRALEALVQAGVVHRLESRNAYFACHTSHRSGTAHVVLTCAKCNSVAEVAGEAVFAAIEAAAGKADFHASGSIVEVFGQCGNCA